MKAKLLDESKKLVLSNSSRFKVDLLAPQIISLGLRKISRMRSGKTFQLIERLKGKAKTKL